MGDDIYSLSNQGRSIMLNKKIVQWHKDRNLIDGATDFTQSGKLMEEFLELIASQFYGQSPDKIASHAHEMIENLLVNGRIKTVESNQKQIAKLDAIGDMVVVLINIAERNGVSIEHCTELAWSEIKNRKGKMINGSFVKESDLIGEIK